MTNEMELDRLIRNACDEKLAFWENAADAAPLLQKTEHPQTVKPAQAEQKQAKAADPAHEIVEIRTVSRWTHVLRLAASFAVVIGLAAAAALLLPRLRGRDPQPSAAATGESAVSLPTQTVQSGPLSTETDPAPAKKEIQLLQQAAEPFSGRVPGYHEPITGVSADAALSGLTLRFRLVIGYDEKNDRTVICLSADIWAEETPHVITLSLRAEDENGNTIPALCVPEIELGTGGEPYLTRSIPGRAALAAKGEACVSFDDVYYVSYRGTLCLEIKQGGTEE